ncbi:hypothetical protein D1007_56359 [Hordeum vulgare]|nr:hypothetical protein D1007_56359 [Hordeum vulgare]
MPACGDGDMSSSLDAEPPSFAPFDKVVRDVLLPRCAIHPMLTSHFTVIHCGYFLCSGKQRGYYKGHSIWYDYCDIDNWTPNVVASLVEEIGYESEGGIRAYCGIRPEKEQVQEEQSHHQQEQQVVQVQVEHADEQQVEQAKTKHVEQLNQEELNHAYPQQVEQSETEQDLIM